MVGPITYKSMGVGNLKKMIASSYWEPKRSGELREESDMRGTWIVKPIFGDGVQKAICGVGFCTMIGWVFVGVVWASNALVDLCGLR